MTENPRIAIAGSVNSSKKVLRKLIEHRMNVVLALGLDPVRSMNVNGFQDLKPIAEGAGLDFRYFNKINDEEIIELIKKKSVDLFFIVGLSQIVRKPLLKIPRLGCVGYHPTRLPKGRGRAAIAWIVLGKAEAAASFFLMDEGIDSGPLLAQVKVETSERDYAQDVIDKILDGIDEAMNELLPKLKAGSINFKTQDARQATYLGKRGPEDGLINWEKKADEVTRLIMAVSRPLPGAFTFYKTEKIIVWRAHQLENYNHFGVPGRILEIHEDGFLVQAGSGVIKITEFEGINDRELKVGRKLGIDLTMLITK